MDLTSKKVLKSLCHKYGVWPKKLSGQNFLISQNILNKIIEASELKEDDIILEVGPGLGTLTSVLVPHIKKMVAVERDRRFYKILKNILSFKNLKLICGDILSFEIQKLLFQITGGQPYKIVSNLPFAITSRFIKLFLEDLTPPAKMILTIQKEVAERIVARSGKMSLLSVSVQFFSKPKIISIVPRENFWPQPEVDAAILEISNINKYPLGFQKEEIKNFFRLVKAGFSTPRKQLKNNLANIKIPPQKVQEFLRKAELGSKARAQELSVENWIELMKELPSF